MKSLAILLTFFAFALASPAPKAEAEAVAEPWYFYGAIQSSTTTAPLDRRTAAPEPVAISKRELVVRSDEIIPTELLTKRGNIQKRNLSPTSGTYANQCGPNNPGPSGIVYTCSPANFGPCCSINGWCGGDSYYCGGGCQDVYGSCILPYLQLTYDADAGDAIWDVNSDTVFDSEVGDGIMYFGASKSPIRTPFSSILYPIRAVVTVLKFFSSNRWLASMNYEMRQGEVPSMRTRQL
ncbi:hypothetical protein RUND412_001654 [Rhizina undulata]